MTNAIGTVYQNYLLDAALGVNQFVNYPDPCFAALWTVTPARDGTGGTEVANANGYARLSVDATDNTLWPPASSNLKANATVLTFPTASGNWGTVTAVTLHDSGTYGGGSLFLVLPLAAARTINNGTTPRFVIGGLRLAVPA